jgi:hypothetical protein
MSLRCVIKKWSNTNLVVLSLFVSRHGPRTAAIFSREVHDKLLRAF